MEPLISERSVVLSHSTHVEPWSLRVPCYTPDSRESASCWRIDAAMEDMSVHRIGKHDSCAATLYDLRGGGLLVSAGYPASFMTLWQVAQDKVAAPLDKPQKRSQKNPIHLKCGARTMGRPKTRHACSI